MYGTGNKKMLNMLFVSLNFLKVLTVHFVLLVLRVIK